MHTGISKPVCHPLQLMINLQNKLTFLSKLFISASTITLSIFMLIFLVKRNTRLLQHSFLILPPFVPNQLDLQNTFEQTKTVYLSSLQ